MRATSQLRRLLGVKATIVEGVVITMSGEVSAGGSAAVEASAVRRVRAAGTGV